MSFINEEDDEFDRLPDAILRLIFNKLHDAESLSRCNLVCKRFASLIPQVDNVYLTVPRKSLCGSYDQISKSSCIDCSHRSKSLFKSLIRKVITTPFRHLRRIITLKSSSSSRFDCSYHSPNEILKNFNEIQSLRIELPGYGGELESINDGDSLLRWRAEFGSHLESCVILGSKSFNTQNHKPQEEEEEEEEEAELTDDELKLRVVWTISCLIAASARHYLMQQVVSTHQMLQNVVVTDRSKQGRLNMKREQIEELRSKVNSSAELELSPMLERTPLPALKMKLWYVPVIELPASGCVMRGATLLVIRPVEGEKKAEESDGDLVERVWNGEGGGEEEVFSEAVREMMKKKKSYTLEMNSF